MNKVILMPVDILAMDLSDKAIAYADHMVDKENGVIHLLHVFPKLGTSQCVVLPRISENTRNT